MLTTLVILGLCVSTQAAVQPLLVQDNSQIAFAEDVKVPVVLGVMSRCPDAILCEAVWDRVLPRVRDKVDISLSFVAKMNASDPVYGVECKHGPQECAGNVHQLCVAKHHPTSEWWSFVQCQNFQGRDEIGLLETAVICATIAGFDWETDWASLCAGKDARGEEGVKLLQQSVRNSMELGIEKSCTILINGKRVCIRDGNTWHECEGGHTPGDFIRQINKEYDRLNSVD